jgi:Ca2+-transporting ATPase
MERAEPDIMKRKPRDSSSGIFAGGMGFDVAYQGALVTLLVLISYLIGSGWTLANSSHGMTMAFLTMSMAEIFHSINMRSQRRSIFTLRSQNKFLYIAAAVSFIATTLVCEIPFLAGAFGFEAVSFREYAIAIGLGIVVIPVVELVKLIQRKTAKN